MTMQVAEPEGFGEKQKKGKRKGEAPKFAADSAAPQATAPPAGERHHDWQLSCKDRTEQGASLRAP